MGNKAKEMEDISKQEGFSNIKYAMAGQFKNPGWVMNGKI